MRMVACSGNRSGWGNLTRLAVVKKSIKRDYTDEVAHNKQRKCPPHLVGRVVISGDGDHGDAGLAGADHPRHEIEARPAG